jgi:hypothetical protein
VLCSVTKGECVVGVRFYEVVLFLFSIFYSIIIYCFRYILFLVYSQVLSMLIPV